MSLTSLTIYAAAALLKEKEISPVELTQAHLERIEQLNPRLNAFITITAEIALQQARQAENEILHGGYKGALHGIPLALKDLFETQGIRTTAGSTFFSDYFPTEDASVVQKLKAAGCVMLGKLNMHEIALGVTNENPHFGDCCNPWDLTRITGGSSGGNGAALASGLCMGALGSDTGGSIRIPSALCGVVGLKPTYGRVSLRGVVPLSWNLDHAGPMARSVRDAALILQAVAGYDAADAWSVDMPVEDYLLEPVGDLSGMRIGMAADNYFTDPGTVDSEVLSAIREAGKVFERLGATVEQVSFPDVREAALANGLMTTSDAATYHHRRLSENTNGFGKDVLTRLQIGAANTSTEYSLARRTQSILRRQFTEFFNRYDILLTPTTPTTAPVRGSADAVERARLLTRFTAPFNLTGLPALSIPCGWSGEKMPIGIQLVSKPWAERTLIRAGIFYEQERGFNIPLASFA